MKSVQPNLFSDLVGDEQPRTKTRSSFDVFNCDCTEMLDEGIERMRSIGLDPIVVTDPPFNIGYKYDGYDDRMPEGEYYRMLSEITRKVRSVVVLYPEALHRLSIERGEAPERVVSWVYNSNTRRQHRDIAFYGISPDFTRIPMPYKNTKDKRIRIRMANGETARLYDWWNVDQVKNISACKTAHPCQMPAEVMRRVVGVLPDGIGVIDPFCGSGTTGVACVSLGVPFEGYDINEDYCDIARQRMAEATRCV